MAVIRRRKNDGSELMQTTQRWATCGPIFASCFFEVIEWMLVMYSVSTSTRAVTSTLERGSHYP